MTDGLRVDRQRLAEMVLGFAILSTLNLNGCQRLQRAAEARMVRAEPLPGTPADYGADIDREESQWSKVVKASGAKAE